MPYNALKDWCEPQDTLQLCQHVLVHGAAKWDLIGKKLRCPAALCALRWHALWQQQYSLTVPIKPPKAYSDWELCTLLLATQSSQQSQSNKRTIFAALSKWLPGRTATGLKQAHQTHVQGSEAAVSAKLKANPWPKDLTGLLAAWPGPQPGHQPRLHLGVQAIAAAALKMVEATCKQQQQQSQPPGIKRNAAGAPVSAAAAAVPASGGSCQSDSSCDRPAKVACSTACKAVDSVAGCSTMQQHTGTHTDLGAVSFMQQQPGTHNIVVRQGSPSRSAAAARLAQLLPQPHAAAVAAAAAAAAPPPPPREAASASLDDAAFDAMLREAIEDALLHPGQPLLSNDSISSRANCQQRDLLPSLQHSLYQDEQQPDQQDNHQQQQDLLSSVLSECGGDSFTSANTTTKGAGPAQQGMMLMTHLLPAVAVDQRASSPQAYVLDSQQQALLQPAFNVGSSSTSKQRTEPLPQLHEGRLQALNDCAGRILPQQPMPLLVSGHQQAALQLLQQQQQQQGTTPLVQSGQEQVLLGLVTTLQQRVCDLEQQQGALLGHISRLEALQTDRLQRPRH